MVLSLGQVWSPNRQCEFVSVGTSACVCLALPRLASSGRYETWQRSYSFIFAGAPVRFRLKHWFRVGMDWRGRGYKWHSLRMHVSGGWVFAGLWLGRGGGRWWIEWGCGGGRALLRFFLCCFPWYRLQSDSPLVFCALLQQLRLVVSASPPSRERRPSRDDAFFRPRIDSTIRLGTRLPTVPGAA